MDAEASVEPQTLKDLFNLPDIQGHIAWQPYREGVEIHRLYGDGITGPIAALIRYRAGGEVPLHVHIGYEHIIILAGSQRMGNEVFGTGTLIINPPGTQHKVSSDDGCIVLAIYEKPVRFLQLSGDGHQEPTLMGQ